MARNLIIKLSGFDRLITAELVDQQEPEICQELWERLQQPFEMFCEHTLATGDYFSSVGRPPKHPVTTGTQAKPYGRTQRLLSQLKPGWITYPGGCNMGFPYGPQITEPLKSRGPVVAKVPSEQLDLFFQAGRYVWQAQYRTHKLVTVMVSREEN